MAMAHRQQHDFLAGLLVEKFLRIPRYSADGTRTDGDLWINTTDNVLRFREDGATITLGTAGAIDAEQVRDIVGAVLVEGNNIDVTVNDAGDSITISVENLTTADLSDYGTATDTRIDTRVTAAFINALTGVDADTLGGSSKAFFQNTDNHVDGTTNHVFTAADDTKLGGIATGATANATDAQLRDRSTHTGTQAATTSLTQATARLLGRITAGAGAVEELSADQVTTFLALVAADISDFNAAAVAAVNAGVIDADTLSGSTKAQIVADAIAGISDSAPELLNTLNELAAALGDNPNFATDITALITARSRWFNLALPSGATSAVLPHGLGTKKLIVQIQVDATGRYEDYDVVVDATNITVTDETGGNIPAGRTVLVTAAAG